MRAHSSLRLAVMGAALAGCALVTGVGDLEVVPDEAATNDGGPTPSSDANVEDRSSSEEDVIVDVDGGPDAGNCPSFATFCDDFESGGLSKWTALLETNTGKVSVVDTATFTAFAGKKTMYVVGGPSTPVAGSYPSVGAAARVTVPVVTAGMIAVRAWVFMPKFLGTDTTFLKIFGKNGVDDMNVKVASGGLVKEDTDIPNAGPELVGTKSVPTAKWSCVEWQATIGAGGHQKVLVDGEIALDADEKNDSSEGYDSVQVGFNASNGQVTQDMYFDEVVTATQPIGCQ